ncbi:FMN-binding protein [Flagellimonas sp. S174]|uniref:FMN-binding protein n=1 Tax=Flagellimonas sp. S174 TaxID=3410790 RepID=UPI003BF52D6A
MSKENKSFFWAGAMFFTALFFFGFSNGIKISPRLQEKLNNAVKSTFEVQEFSLQLIEVSKELNSKTMVELGGENLFAVKTNQQIIGYAYLGQAPSMKNIFDYVVLFNMDMSIKKSKVLIYREDYGRQIGSQRWLKQFIGKKTGDELIYAQNIDAIAGATISAKSMTKAINDVLQSIEIVRESNTLK